MVAPVRNGVELQAVGELHLVGLAKLLELLPSLLFPLAIPRPRPSGCCSSGEMELLEFDVVGRGKVAEGSEAVQGGGGWKGRAKVGVLRSRSADAMAGRED